MEAKRAIQKDGILSLWKVPFKIAGSDGRAILGFILLSVTSQGASMADVELQEESEAFDEDADPDGLVVVVEATDKNDLLYGTAKPRFDEKYAKHRNAVHITVKNIDDLNRQLRDLSRDKGPIHRLEMFGHGSPGHIQIGKQSLYLPTLDKLDPGVDLFAPNAKIRLRSCDSGNGTEGQAFLEGLGKRWLDKGGTLYASRVSVVESPILLLTNAAGVPVLPPEVIQRLEMSLSRPTLAVAGVYDRTARPREERWPLSDRVRTVTVPPR